MLTQLNTIKTRLGILLTNVTDDVILTNTLAAVSGRFERECRRAFARTANAVEEFDADDTEVSVRCYPIESIGKFELKATEREGWLEVPEVDYLARRDCVISLAEPLGTAGEAGRVTYTGGYVLPGTVAEAGQTALPADLEQAAVEQVAYWYQNRDRLGAVRFWPKGGIYEEFADIDLLPSVRAVLKHYERWVG